MAAREEVMHLVDEEELRSDAVEEMERATLEAADPIVI
jgi:hypothetical protein